MARWENLLIDREVVEVYDIKMLRCLRGLASSPTAQRMGRDEFVDWLFARLEECRVDDEGGVRCRGK